jgi:hypothetical protein
MLKILIITRDAAESLDVMYPYQRLKGEGYDGTSSPYDKDFQCPTGALQTTTGWQWPMEQRSPR